MGFQLIWVNPKIKIRAALGFAEDWFDQKQIQDVIDIAQRSGKFEVVAALLEYSQKLREKGNYYEC